MFPQAKRMCPFGGGPLGPTGGPISCLEAGNPHMAALNSGSLNYLKIRRNGEWAWPPNVFESTAVDRLRPSAPPVQLEQMVIDAQIDSHIDSRVSSHIDSRVSLHVIEPEVSPTSARRGFPVAFAGTKSQLFLGACLEE